MRRASSIRLGRTGSQAKTRVNGHRLRVCPRRLRFEDLEPRCLLSGFAVNFSADGQCSRVPDSPFLDVTGPFTIEAWIKPETGILSRGYDSILSQQMSGSGYMLSTNYSAAGGHYFAFETAGVQFGGTSQPAIGQWQHVAGVREGSQLRLYVNGVLEGTRQVVSQSTPNSYPLWIGSSPFGAGTNWRGAIDEVRIWSVARTQQQIQQSMGTYLTGQEAGLQAYWTFDEGTGQTFSDATLHGNTGVLGSRANPDADDPSWSDGMSLGAPTDLVNFVVPSDGTLYVKGIGGEAGAGSEFGFGTSIATHVAYLTGLPQVTPEVCVRPVQAGETLHFSLKTQWGGTYYAFSTGSDFASQEAFTDRNNSLGRGGSILEQTGPNTWVLHCDDAASGDDDDNDCLVQLRIGMPPDTTPPRVVTMSPAPGTTLQSAPSTVVATFSEEIDPATITAQTLQLVRSGGDGVFGNGNDVVIVPHSVSRTDATHATMDLSGVAVADDTYQITLVGDTTALPPRRIADLAGNVLDGDGNGSAGGDYVTTFILDAHGPQAIGCSQPLPGGFLDQVDVTFNEAVDASTFDSPDVTLIGPFGVVKAERVDCISATSFRIRFPKQEDGGIYRLSIGPDVRDTVGNPMAQAYQTDIRVKAISGMISFRTRTGEVPTGIVFPRKITATIWQDVSTQYQWPGLRVWTYPDVPGDGRDEFEYHVPIPFLVDETYTIGFSVYGSDEKMVRVTVVDGFVEDFDVVLTYEDVKAGRRALETIYGRSGRDITWRFKDGEFSGEEQFALRRAMDTWASTRLVGFKEATGLYADITFHKCRSADDLGGSGSSSVPPFSFLHLELPDPMWRVDFANDVGFWNTDDHVVYLGGNWSQTTATKLESIALHEIGHCLGLRYPPPLGSHEDFYPDSRGQQWSIMSYDAAGQLLWPGWSDVDALKRINSTSLTVTSFCPVDLVVTDATGNVISKTLNQIPGATYLQEDLDADGDLDDQITIPEPTTQGYSITVIPEPGADPNAPVTLIVDDHGEGRILLDNVRVADLPTLPIGVNVDRTPPVLTLDPSSLVLSSTESWVLVHLNVQVQDETDPRPQMALVAIQPSWDADPGSVIRSADYGQADQDFDLLLARGDEQRSYTVTYAASDATGNVSYATATLYVNNRPVAVAGPDQTAGEGQAVQFDGTGSSDADGDSLSFAWDFGDGTTAAGATPSHVYADNGAYTVTLTVDDGYYDGSRSDTLQVTVNNVPPTVVVRGSDAVMLSDPFILTLTASDVSPVDEADTFTYRIDWSGDNVVDLEISGASTYAVNHIFSQAGTFHVQVWAVDKDGGESIAAATHSVLVKIPVQIEVKPGDSDPSLNLASNGRIAVVLFTTNDFDARLVDLSTVVFAGARAANWTYEDVDGDGDLDLLMHFETQKTNLRAIYTDLLLDDANNVDDVLDSTRQEATVTLSGKTTDDLTLEGSDQLNLFLSGKKLRDLLDRLHADGLL